MTKSRKNILRIKPKVCDPHPRDIDSSNKASISSGWQSWVDDTREHGGNTLSCQLFAKLLKGVFYRVHSKKRRLL